MTSVLRLLKRILRPTLIIVLATFAGPHAMSADLRPFSAEYKVRAHIVLIGGTAEMHLQRESDGSFIFEFRARATGILRWFGGWREIQETSRFLVKDGQLLPLWFNRVDTFSDDERDLELDFDWSSGVYRRGYYGIVDELPIPEKPMVPGLLFIAVMVDQMHGRSPQAYTLIDHDRIEVLNIVDEGPESIITKAGRFPTTIYSHHTKEIDRTTRLWSSADTEFVPVRMAQYDSGKKRLTFELTKVSFDDGRQ